MQWFNVDEAVFYAAVWSVAFISSIFVTLGDADIESTRKCFSVGGISGFLAFSTTAVLCGRVTDPLSGHWYYLGVAALIGLSANQQEQIRQRLLDIILQRNVQNIPKED